MSFDISYVPKFSAITVDFSQVKFSLPELNPIVFRIQTQSLHHRRYMLPTFIYGDFILQFFKDINWFATTIF